MNFSAAGTGTAAALAGCSSMQNNTQPTDDGESSGSEPTVTVAVNADQQKLRQRQQEISSEYKAGNITRSEARKQFQTAQQKLRAEAVNTFTARASSKSSLSIDNSIKQLGVLLVTGASAELINSLSFSEVNGLLPAQTFQQAKAQAAQQTETTTN
ncbi:hypothetical protein [Halospeciosus flavus]|uniref:hypothetical protein n=1 Tax=Halospeciosus flavus TaxID=3032283 RepID=UPI00361C15B0